MTPDRFTQGLLGLTAGVLLAVASPWLMPRAVLVGFALLGLLLLALRHRPWAVATSLLLLAFAHSQWRAQSLLDARWPMQRSGEKQLIAGHVVSLPEVSVAADGSRTLRFRFAAIDTQWPRSLRVSVYRSHLPIAGGDCWALPLKLKAPHGSANPGGFDYEGWLFQQGIAATASSNGKDASRCQSPMPGLIAPATLKLREGLRAQVHAALPQHPALGILLALLMGDDSGVSDASWEVYRQTGTTHLIAISGFNLAIIAAAVFFFWRWLWPLSTRLALWLPAQTAAAIAAALAATGYALLAGFEAPVVRALWMLWVGLLALLLRRGSGAFQALALAWGLLLLVDPLAVLSPSVWLSYAAVAAMIYLALGRLKPLSWWRALLYVQIGLGLLLAPLTLFWFQSSPALSGMVNVLAVPWFALLTPIALLVALLLLIAPAWAATPLLWVADALQHTEAALAWLGRYSADSQVLLAASPWALLCAALGMVLLLAPRALPGKALGLLCLLPLLNPVPRAPVDGFRITLLDVGQGLSVLIETAQHRLLLDAGPAFDGGFDAGARIVVPTLRAMGVRHLDALIVSHGDADHAGGAAAVQAAFPVRRALGFGAAEACRRGQRWQWDGVDFHILHGPDDATGLVKRDNNGSCVLRVQSGAGVALLPADIEGAGEAALIQRWGEATLKADVLIAPHHGSKTSSSPDFVAAVNPEWLLVPAGYANAFRHPRAVVLERYQRLGTEIAMTGHEGALSLSYSSSKGWSGVQRYRARWPRPYWQQAPLELPEHD